MTATTPSPVLTAVIRVAVKSTGAARGRLMIAGPELPHVVAIHGAGNEWWEVGASAIAGYVIATGQPQVLTHQAPATDTAAVSALCVACTCDDEVVGAIELEDKARGGPFTIDDLELAGLLGGIAGAALARRRPTTPPDPTRLSGDLGRLAAADWPRYATIARLVRSLLDA